MGEKHPETECYSADVSGCLCCGGRMSANFFGLGLAYVRFAEARGDSQRPGHKKSNVCDQFRGDEQ